MSLCHQIDAWNTVTEERSSSYPCEKFARPPYKRYLRAVDVDAPAEVVFRWLCQLKVAPYSYDWLDNLGRRSPATLTPGAEELAVGQWVMIGRIVEFEKDRHITIVGSPRADRLFGPVTLTYQVTSHAQNTARLIACITVTADSWLGRLRRSVLGVGDLVMMRRELLNFKRLAERQHRQALAR